MGRGLPLSCFLPPLFVTDINLGPTFGKEQFCQYQKTVGGAQANEFCTISGHIAVHGQMVKC